MNERVTIDRLEVESVDFACALLDKVQKLLDGGRRWHSVGLAATKLGCACEPTASNAHYFSLEGAACRALVEMPQHSQRNSSSAIWTEYTLQVLTNGESGHTWLDCEMLLLGLKRALGEYRAMFEERRKRA
jgi:hypothetical protein